MYRYDSFDQTLVDERVAQFRDQTRRYLAGELTDDEFRPLRLMNGLYIQRHAPMLRVSIPYGLLSSEQMRMLAHIARTYDRGYGHFTTRQNIQYNWPALESVPDILADLARVEMHAIQTSGNCIRNITSDHLAGVAADELTDPRPYCELIRQWATLHPEFSYLPRKFKIAVSASESDRAAIRVHDIGLQVVHDDDGRFGFRVFVGGGLGRTPVVGECIREFLPEEDLLSYLEAILRVYNLNGRRDNIHKARIKILVRAMGAEAFGQRVEAEWQHLRGDPRLTLAPEDVAYMQGFFQAPPYDSTADGRALKEHLDGDPAFTRWYRHNTVDHRQPGYRAVFLSLKAPAVAPGDLTDAQMDAVAALAERYGFGEIRVTHTQNLILPDVRQDALHALWQELRELNLATPNVGTMTDMICCPGLDFCSLANAGSIDVARDINERFDNLDDLYDLGDIRLNMSGCMNACGHHHVGHIGILGVDKKGEEFYQITVGGSSSNDAGMGERIGPAVAKDRVADTLESILHTFVAHREGDEPLIDTYRRIGVKPFKEAAYA
ncbi:nitrite/sulfite reductase [Aquisalimonas lutea]|uniref:nitrite/sulfite reductase n=1 Tax=Aquisalimonas lutea TaxID=1327750 RepID=UPI0025B3EC12|nr:nitrite/sulfite reductase [Aquisalimonas lutea]MDN3518422.1 nitrite/sulfite reductase [Aquisalimonas lutea]